MKDIYKNSILSVIYYVVNMLSNLYITQMLVEKLGLELYGFYPLASNVSSYLVIICMVVNSMAARFISLSIAKKDVNKAQEYYSSIFFANVFLSGILIIPIVVCVIFVDRLFDIPATYIFDVKLLFLGILVSVIINMATTVFAVATVAKNRLDLQYRGRIFQVILKIGLFIAIYHFFEARAYYIGGIFVLFEGYYFIFQYTIKKKIMPELKVKKESYNLQAIKDVLLAGTWSSLNQLGNSLLFGADAIIGNVMLGAATSGIIGIVHIVPATINSLITAISGVYIPKYIEDYAGGKIKNIEKMVKMSQSVMGVFISTIICLFFIFGETFYSLYVPENNSLELARLANIYILPLLFTGVFWSVSNLNLVWNKIKLPAIFTIINGCLNILCMIFLIKFTTLGIRAIPITTSVLTFFWYVFLIPVYVSKQTEIKLIEFYKVPIIIIFILVPFELIFYSFVFQTVKIEGWIGFFIIGGICGLIGLIFGAVLMKRFYRLEKYESYDRG